MLRDILCNCIQMGQDGGVGRTRKAEFKEEGIFEFCRFFLTFLLPKGKQKPFNMLLYIKLTNKIGIEKISYSAVLGKCL